MSSWFTKSESLSEFTPEKKTGGGGGNNWPFFLKAGTSSEITFLNPDEGEGSNIPILHFHNLTVLKDGKPSYERVACSMPKDGNCPFCDYTKAQPEGVQWKTRAKKVHCVSVLEDSGNENAEGELYPPTKRLRLSNEKDMATLKEHRKTIQDTKKGAMKDLNGIHLCTFSVSRSEEDKAAAIGVVGSFVVKIEADSQPDLAPFTGDEIMSFFVTDPEEIAAIAESYQSTATIGADAVRDV